ncbi:hypothetical protein D3C75_469750 [compost metagenome]
MAVRIISIGKLPSEREWIGTCSKCKTVVEFLQSDATSSGNDQRDGDWAKLKCPLAGCTYEIFGSIKPHQFR